MRELMEQHCVLPESVVLEGLRVIRDQAGRWRLTGRVRVTVDLGDGRTLHGFKPLTVGQLVQEGRKPRKQTWMGGEAHS